MMIRRTLAAVLLLALTAAAGANPAASPVKTIALWVFDEQQGVYPSSALDDVSDSNFPLVIGKGGQIVEGKFGNALEPLEQPAIHYPKGTVEFGLASPPDQPGRKSQPVTWYNALFCALMTSGETHLRKEVTFANPTRTPLNLGRFDWTVEFWYMPTRTTDQEGVVFEIGTGPRGESDTVTRLAIDHEQKNFVLTNRPSGTVARISSNRKALSPYSGQWHHHAFVYSASESMLRHFVDGKNQGSPVRMALQPLPAGEAAYMSIGRDGLWNRVLPGRIDELRFSEGKAYTGRFPVPASFSPAFRSGRKPAAHMAGLPLLFAPGKQAASPVPLEGRKHVFIDDALLERAEHVVFTAHPPRAAERVLDNLTGPVSEHMNVIEDERGLIRLYFGVHNNHLALLTSQDGIQWSRPRVRPDAAAGMDNVVIPEPTGNGVVFLDPNAPPEKRWKYVSGYEGRGVYVYSSPDGYTFRREKIAALPFRSVSQSSVFYDDQRQLYAGYHPSDFPRTTGGNAQREFVLTETVDIAPPWPFARLSQSEMFAAAKVRRLSSIIPWYLENGPLTPGGFGIEYPAALAPGDALDPPGSGIHAARALKYPWAPDTYVAFPLLRFQYEEGPAGRRTLADKERGRGSGAIETQVAVSRDGVKWKRFPRPAYVAVGRHEGDPVHQACLAHGMIRRGDEIWQYYLGSGGYYGSHRPGAKRAVYRVVQRMDGFVSAQAPYDRTAVLVTKILRFKGNRLVLNIDTGATGYAQVGLLNEQGVPIRGFATDDCVYINGNFTDTEIEWVGKGKDISELAGRHVKVEIKMRGARLYAMQFVQR